MIHWGYLAGGCLLSLIMGFVLCMFWMRWALGTKKRPAPSHRVPLSPDDFTQMNPYLRRPAEQGKGAS